ncbi:MAG: 4-alpha-glucanotransferase [Spirochaetaceae bacterium]|nr:4-alpha-glucanotransferase [Spirochaetaceae bacterium]
MFSRRKSGILLHISSLPDSPGIGTLGESAFEFVNWLKAGNQSFWQMLPIGPTGYGDSPYASFSSFAGNPLFVDLNLLAKNGWATEEEIRHPYKIKTTGNVNYPGVIKWKIPLLLEIGGRFAKNPGNAGDAFREFKEANSHWLDDYALFMNIKDFYEKKLANRKNPHGITWFHSWPKPLARKEEEAVEKWRGEHNDEIEAHKAIQFFFRVQWDALKRYANDNGICLIGDIPIFVAPNSADVWANQKEFLLGRSGKPTLVSGVPPDYFSETGQLWGNPLFNWKKMARDDFAWWISRIRQTLTFFDAIRVDHFRGFEAFWAVPSSETTAQNGTWIKAPGEKFFKAVKAQLGDVPIIAEDLGVITDEVTRLRTKFNFPGMKILQFAFNKGEIDQRGYVNPYMPHQFENPNCVAYTGTHDNTTLAAYIDSLSPDELMCIKKYVGTGIKYSGLHNEMIRLLFASIANTVIIPMQDVFGLGEKTRMNAPSTTGGTNWQWRMIQRNFSHKKAEGLARLSYLYGRNL